MTHVSELIVNSTQFPIRINNNSLLRHSQLHHLLKNVHHISFWLHLHVNMLRILKHRANKYDTLFFHPYNEINNTTHLYTNYHLLLCLSNLKIHLM